MSIKEVYKKRKDACICYTYVARGEESSRKLGAQIADFGCFPFVPVGIDLFLKVVLKVISQNRDGSCDWSEGSGCQVFLCSYLLLYTCFPPPS